MLKIALVVPKKNPIVVANCAPFGLAYIASYLKKQMPTCEIAIINGDVGHDINQMLFDFQPNIVGVTASTSQAPAAYELGNMLKRNRTDILTVIGGVHASALPLEASEHFDCVVVGEGEVAFTRIVQEFSLGHRSHGIIQGEEIADLDSLPKVDYDLLNIEEYLKCKTDLPSLPEPCMSIGTSRGCPFKCPFCYSSGRATKVRYFTAERVTEEILFLHEKYGVNNFYFTDDEFLVNIKRLKGLKEKFDEKGISKWIRYGCQARSKTLTIPTLELAKSTGCTLISIGLESGCQRILDYLKNNTVTLQDHERALENCAKVGIVAGGNFIYGTFDQTLEEMKESYDWAREQKHIMFVGTGILIPFPATAVWKKCQELHLLPKNIDYSRLILTNNVKQTYIVNIVVPLETFGKFMVNTARMMRLYAKKNYVKSSWRFIREMWKRPVYYWAWLFHPLQMMKITLGRK